MNLKDKTLLYIGPDSGNSYSRYLALQSYFKKTELASYRHLYKNLKGRVLHKFAKPLFYKQCTAFARQRFDAVKPDIVWVEMGRELNAELIEHISSLGIPLINTYSDSFTDTTSKKVSKEYNQSIPYYDAIFTPRQSDFELYKQHGAKEVLKFWKGYDSTSISNHKEDLNLDFVFAGHLEEYRGNLLKNVINKNDFNYKIYGHNWESMKLENTHPSTSFEAYATLYKNAKIGVNFFSQWANDTQNSRLFEIPGSRTFLFTEYSVDAEACFKEGEEAEFFRSEEEFSDKLKFYLKNEDKIKKIADAGYKVTSEKYTNSARIEQMISNIKAVL
jgi:spore maturation protein CgeB